MHDFETKYLLSNAHALKVKTWLEKNFAADPEYPEAIISSIYFDTPHMKYLEEKVNSDHIKSKFRIRWYEDPVTRKKSEICFLEFKHKVGEKRFKRRLKMPNHYGDLPLESSTFFSVMNDLRIHEGVVLDHIFPSFIVSYTRKRFIIPQSNMRLCIDFNINVPRTNLRLVRKNAKKKYLANCVFELKGPSAVLPKELEYLERLGVHKNAFSKYERCFFELIENEG
jgi:SPX domain protein involved in polyphosphate accumulation